MALAPDPGRYLAAPHLLGQGRLASARRVHYADDLGLWLISGHQQVRAALADQEAFRNAQTLMPIYQPCAAAAAILAKIDAPPTTAAADPPIHPRNRRALRAAFASGRSTGQAYSGIVTRRVNRLVMQVAARRRERVDLVAEFAGVLPLLVVADIIGVPEPDLSRVKNWADGQIALVWARPNPGEQVRLAKDLLDFWTYSQQLVNNAVRAHAAAHRTDTFLSRVLQWRTRVGDDQVSDAEIASLAFNLLVAGHETTAGLIAHALDHALTGAPERWHRIASHPEAAAEHVGETLRFTPPIDGWLRTTSRQVTIGATTIPASARCMLLIGAANRDPARFDHPDTFHPGRPAAADHLSFGHGPHYCVGAALARLEAAALGALATVFPRTRLAPDYQRVFRPNAAFRALRTLPVLPDQPSGTYAWQIHPGGHSDWL